MGKDIYIWRLISTLGTQAGPTGFTGYFSVTDAQIKVKVSGFQVCRGVKVGWV